MKQEFINFLYCLCGLDRWINIFSLQEEESLKPEPEPQSIVITQVTDTESEPANMSLTNSTTQIATDNGTPTTETPPAEEESSPGN